MRRNTDRRRFLKATGVAGLAGIAGCAGLFGGGDGEFPSEPIEYIVPYGEGSGFDQYSRGVAPIWENQFEEDVDITVDNVTGGGGQRGTETVYTADPDGYTVGILNIPGFAINQALEDVNYDLREMTHLGRVVRATYVLQTNPDNDVETWEDLAEMDEVDWGITGIGSTASFVAILTSRAADIELNFVAGYDGGTDVLRALQQGELDAALYTASTSRPFIEDGNTQPILQYTDEPVEYLSEDVPMTEDTDTFQGFQDLNLSRIISAPPDLPDDVTETLRDTLWDALQSDEYEEWGEENGRATSNRLRGEDAADVIDSAFDTAEANADTLEQYIDE